MSDPTGQHPADPDVQPSAAPQPSHDAPAGSRSAPEAPQQGRPRASATGRGWVPLVGVAVTSAVLASLLTGGIVSSLQDNTSPAATATTSTQQAQAAPVSAASNANPDWGAVAQAAGQSVVAVAIQGQTGSGEGSGVVLDQDGNVLTNNHVVEGAGQSGQIMVTLSDGRQYEATVLGTDPATDLAVLKIEDAPDDLVPAVIGDSGDVEVGDSVMAVGNPLGLSDTVTTGIVSALDRPVTTPASTATNGPGDAVVTNAIQTDAAVNPGNSGGALVDAQGRVVGITSSIASLGSNGSSSGSIGLGFAIPIDEAERIAGQLADGDVAEHAWLGVFLQDATVESDGSSRGGAEVARIVADSPAATSGLRTGDTVIALNDAPTNDSLSLTAHVRERGTDDKVTLTVVRDGKQQAIEVTLGTAPTR